MSPRSIHFTAAARPSGFVWLFLALWLSLGRRWRAVTSTLHLRMMLRTHLLLVILPAHLLLMVQCTHLLLVMLSGHLLLMMLSVYLLLMIHYLLPVSRSFVLDSFVMRGGTGSADVVIVALKIFCLVFVPEVLGSMVLTMCFAVHSCSLRMLFTGDAPRFVLSFSRSGCACGSNVLSDFALPVRLIK